jgi:hypothetical protein
MRGSGGRIGLAGRPCFPRVVRRWRAESSGKGSGRRLRRACRVKMLQRPLVSRRRLERDGSGRPAACHQRCLGPQRSRALAAISRWRNAKRSRSCARKAAPCRTLPAGSGERRRPYPANCGATPPPGAAAWSTEPRRRNGMPSDQPVDPRRRSLRSTQPCGPMCRSAWPAWSSLQAAPRSRSGRVVEGPPAWETAGPAMGARLEPGADRPALTDRLSGR